MDIVFSCSDVIKLQVVADSRLDGGTEEQRHWRAETWSCDECSVSRPSAGALLKKINHEKIYPKLDTYNQTIRESAPPNGLCQDLNYSSKICFVCLFVCVQARKPLSAFGREGRHRLKRPGDNSRRVRRGKLMKLLGNLCGSEHLCDCQ